MAEDGSAAPPTTVGGGHAGDSGMHSANDGRGRSSGERLERIVTPLSPGATTPPNPFSRRHTSLDMDDYFVGPRDTQKHSKWPLFMQMHGSILPKLIMPLLFMGLWAALITSLHMAPYFKERNVKVSVNSVLLTVLGFVVGLGLSFRSSTAYERYAEGRRYWASLILASQSLGRVFWIHAREREETREKDILNKLSALNLLTAFAVALKHKLRFEPYTNYEDLSQMVGHLDTLAGEATKSDGGATATKSPNIFKRAGTMLGVPFFESNPRKQLKKATRPLGNLPLEILSYLAAYTDEIVANGQLPVPMQQTLAYNNMALLNDVMVGTERVLSTPLPIAYSIAIAQITWLYVFLLPFQLCQPLEWVAIPATVAASYIILGLLYIGREIEQPFGLDPNDLPLESYCAQIAAELDVLASRPKPRISEWTEHLENKVLFPYSNAGWHAWLHRGETKIRQALRAKTELEFGQRSRMMGQEHGKNEGGSGHGRSMSKPQAAEKVSDVENGLGSRQ
ncbi:hypothetical protein MCOR25_003621 [Pyricularia grisea]|uniref:Uncharacterized protein n=1 Tax=Pyricularia grisea TaxID=148305 RepID=A0A6P8B757_PYRGI|nr:hypothetical protein PgNI_06687 [Pyricularia grisea]KAI6372884.1 hypothetical protein MCOR25_003621 [Pyricularia grisea]TLD11161.1 hypothetical protein PgNI_06687 [Pyricularia grisea]